MLSGDKVIADIEAGLAESDAGLGVDTAALRKCFSLLRLIDTKREA